MGRGDEFTNVYTTDHPFYWIQIILWLYIDHIFTKQYVWGIFSFGAIEIK